jgi:hypothetical protein
MSGFSLSVRYGQLQIGEGRVAGAVLFDDFINLLARGRRKFCGPGE